ncbi:MAG TPA: glycosyltransferase [Burkholderiales bacterium]|nr:glycosyltransferase [Burkholderiales bacterium]
MIASSPAPSSKPLRIAALVRELPIPVYAGLNLIVHHVLGRLSRRNEVLTFVLDRSYGRELGDYFLRFTCAPESAGAASASVDGIPKVARYYRTSAHTLAWLETALVDFAPDVLLGFDNNVAPYLALLSSPVPKVLDAVDSEILYLWRQVRRGDLRVRTVKHLLAALASARLYFPRSDAVVAVSDEDRDNLRLFSGHQRIETIPNGVDCDFFAPRPEIPKTRGRLVFTGSLSWPPNRAAVRWFLDSCWADILRKRPDASLVIIGKLGTEALKQEWEKHPNVEVIGFVPDIREHVLQAEVSIAPMVSGSGIKNKILEAWALGQPVVATALAARGIRCQVGRDISIAEDAESFVSAVLRLLDDPALRSATGAAGRNTALARYSWEQVAENFENLLRDVASKALRSGA